MKVLVVVCVLLVNSSAGFRHFQVTCEKDEELGRIKIFRPQRQQAVLKWLPTTGINGQSDVKTGIYDVIIHCVTEKERLHFYQFEI